MAGPEKIAVDASVAFKWFVEERDSSIARQIVEDYSKRHIDITSVELLPFEVLNALRYAPDSGLENLKVVSSAIDKLSLDIRPLREGLSERCVENAFKYGISIYDSSYLSLGELEGVPVYTADEKLIKRVGGAVLRHISEYKAL